MCMFARVCCVVCACERKMYLKKQLKNNLKINPLADLFILKYLLFLSLDQKNYGLVGRVFTNGLGDLGSIPGRVIPKTLKVVLDTSLLNTQQYKVRIKG